MFIYMKVYFARKVRYIDDLESGLEGLQLWQP